MNRAALFNTAVMASLLALPLADRIGQAEELPSNQRAQAKLEGILATKIDFESQNVSLREVVTNLAKKHGFELQIDERELAAHWISLDVPASVNFTNQTIKSVLELLLRLQGLKPRIEDGIVVIDCAERPLDWAQGLRTSFGIEVFTRGVPQRIGFSLVLQQSESRCGFELVDTMLPPEDDEGRRRLIAQRAIYSMLGGGFNTKERFAEHLQSRLIKRIDAEHHVCGLTESQREKLQLAGNGDVQTVIQHVEHMCDQFRECYEPGDATVELPDEFVGNYWRLKQTQQRGVCGNGTRYSRMHERLLTASQKQKLQIVASFRGTGAIVRTDSDRGVGVFEILLTSCPLNETVLSNLASFPELETLSLDETTAADDELRHLKSVPNLVALDLAKTGISDEGMKHIAALESLERLALSNTRVTDAGIELLLSLKKLKWIDVSDTAITDAGVAKLVARFPEIMIPR